MRSGVVAVIGRPNVGKSTLINALVGEKVSIVSRRPQTTRHAIQGVMHGDELQVVFVDTPGLHEKQPRAINRQMNRAATASLIDADLVLFVVQAGARRPDDEAAFERATRSGVPVGLVISKVDLLERGAEVAADISWWGGRFDWAFIVPLTARKGTNLDALRREIAQRMPEGPPLYPPDQVRGYDFRFAVSEIVREKLIGRLRDEVPHALTVETESVESEGGVTRISAVIWVEREGQKRIVIGDKGAVLKRVGMLARRELEPMCGEKVFLKLWVRVKPGWSDDERALQQLGLTPR